MKILNGNQMILDGKRKTKMFQIIYIPRIHDEVAVAQFATKDEAEAYMELIKEKRPKAYPHHYIKENKEYPVDSSITKGTRMDDNYYYFRQKEKEDGSN